MVFSFNGARPALTLNALTKMLVPYTKPFNHFTKDCKPITDRARKYSENDKDFIRQETKRLLNDDMIEGYCNEKSAVWKMATGY